MIELPMEEKQVRILIILPESHLTLLDALKRRMATSSRGKTISALLESVIDVQPPSVEVARRMRPRRREGSKAMA